MSETAPNNAPQPTDAAQGAPAGVSQPAQAQTQAASSIPRVPQQRLPIDARLRRIGEPQRTFANLNEKCRASVFLDKFTPKIPYAMRKRVDERLKFTHFHSDDNSAAYMAREMFGPGRQWMMVFEIVPKDSVDSVKVEGAFQFTSKPINPVMNDGKIEVFQTTIFMSWYEQKLGQKDAVDLARNRLADAVVDKAQWICESALAEMLDINPDRKIMDGTGVPSSDFEPPTEIPRSIDMVIRNVYIASYQLWQQARLGVSRNDRETKTKRLLRKQVHAEMEIKVLEFMERRRARAKTREQGLPIPEQSEGFLAQAEADRLQQLDSYAGDNEDTEKEDSDEEGEVSEKEETEEGDHEGNDTKMGDTEAETEREEPGPEQPAQAQRTWTMEQLRQAVRSHNQKIYNRQICSLSSVDSSVSPFSSPELSSKDAPISLQEAAKPKGIVKNRNDRKTKKQKTPNQSPSPPPLTPMRPMPALVSMAPTPVQQQAETEAGSRPRSSPSQEKMTSTNTNTNPDPAPALQLEPVPVPEPEPTITPTSALVGGRRRRRAAVPIGSPRRSARIRERR